ncbi:MAG: D-glycero-beta-D-manno-heptose 1,7-bisphosphate 7-phosphatase [Gammaproteobacteria bacterium]
MKLVILDRDGVINIDQPDDYVKSEGEWQAIPGSLEAIGTLSRNGFHVVILSNQAGLAHGRLTIEDLNAIHRKMLTHLSQYGGVIDAILFCPHAPEDGCDCRKPNPGLFHELSRRLRVSLEGVTAVGDKLSDIEAARAAGASPVLVRTGYGQGLVDAGEVPAGVPVYADLAAVVTDLVARG